MSATSGPKIANDGLVFHYDMENTDKSWKGKPTVNVIETDLTLYTKDNGCTVVAIGEYYLGNPVYRVTFNYGTLPRIRTNFSYTAGQQFNGSIYYRMVTQGSHTPAFYFREAGFGTSYASVPLNSTEWTRANLNYTFSSSGTSMFLLYQASGTSTSDTVIDFAMPQTELGSFATPFVAGTRSNTQAILDLTKNHTVQINNATYGSNGDLSLSGLTDQYITVSAAALHNLTSWSIDFWLERTTTNAIDTFLSCGAANNFLWYFQGNNINFQNPPDTGLVYGVTNGDPFNFVATGAGNSIRVYKNGSLVGTMSNTTIINVASVVGQGIVIGQELDANSGGFDPSQSWKGKIHVCKFYDRVLTDQEIKNNYEARKSKYI